MPLTQYSNQIQSTNISASVSPKGLSKKVLTTTSILSILGCFSFAPVAQAQTSITDCSPFNIEIPGVNAVLNIDVNQTCTTSSGDNIELEDNSQDNVVINVAGGSILENTDTSDEDTVIFLDNSEVSVVI